MDSSWKDQKFWVFIAILAVLGFGPKTGTLRMSGHERQGGGKAVIVAEGSLFSTKAVK
jgi:hypothetical protein